MMSRCSQSAPERPARSALLPQLNAYVNKTLSHNVPGAIFGSSAVQTGERNPVAYGFDVYQTIFDFGKSLSNFKASRQVYKATQAHTGSVKRLATLEFIVAYFDVLEAQALIEGESQITLIPKGSETIKELTALLPEAEPSPTASPARSAWRSRPLPPTTASTP